MPVIDADAHVIETERSWEFMDPADAGARPVLAAPDDDPGTLHWVIDDLPRRRANLVRGDNKYRSLPRGRNTAVPEEAREMADLEARIRHMDQLGIDVQVLHNTLFIETIADRVETEVAVCKSWNRWLADIWKQGQRALPLVLRRAHSEPRRCYSADAGGQAERVRGRLPAAHRGRTAPRGSLLLPYL